MSISGRPSTNMLSNILKCNYLREREKTIVKFLSCVPNPTVKERKNEKNLVISLSGVWNTSPQNTSSNDTEKDNPLTLIMPK